jgi:hypothetical protein
MDEPTGHVKGDKPKQPQDDQQDDNSPQHVFTSRDRLALHGLAARGGVKTMDPSRAFSSTLECPNL